MIVQPYLFFDGKCDEAIEFYRRALGAEVTMLMRFKESPDAASVPPGGADKVMHAALRIGDTMVFVSDGHCSGKPNFQGFGLSLTAKTDAEAKQRFDTLADGGRVEVPLGPTFFASSFGMVVDRFGVLWMVMVEKK